MTNVARLPLPEAAYDRLTARQREANIAAEGQPVDLYADPRVADQVSLYETYKACKAVVNGNDWYSADLVHDALQFIHAYESATPRETSLDVLKKNGVRPVLVYALLFSLAGYAALFGWMLL